MFYRHLHAESCELSRVGEEAPKSELQALRDERDRLVKFAKSVGHPQWCKGFMTRDAELCSCGWYVIFPAALTPAGGG